MVDNVNSFKFGKLSGEFLKNLKTGLKETDLKTEKEIKLFRAIDADKNGVIDKSEIDKLYNALDTSQDGEISKKEAKAYLKEKGLEDLKKKDLKNFLNKYVENTEDVANAEVVEGKVQITYKDGSQEIVNSDRSKELINKDAQGNTVKKEVTEDYKLKHETVTAQNGDTKATKYAEDGKTIQQTVEKEVGTNTTTTVNYENGKKSSKKVEKGTTEENYKYEDEAEVLDSKIENKGIPAKEKHTKYTYNADKSVTETITEPAAKRITVRTKSETGVVEDITDESGKIHNVYNANNKKLSQTKMVNGKTYSIQYDGAGNTSVVVQNGESIDSLAKKFGCTKEEIINANKELLNGKKYFNVGETIKIPRELEANTKALQGRKSSEGAKAEFARYEQIRAQKRAEAKARAAAENKAYKELGLKNHIGARTSITDEKGNKYTVVGQAGYGRTIAKDKKGNIHVISHDKKDLKTQYVKVDVANVKAGKKRIVINNRAYYTDGKARDKHGRMTVTDWTGKTSTLSGGKSKTDLSDRKILKDGYVEASDAIDAGHGKATYLENGIKYAQSSDGTYWYFDEKGQALNANQVEKQIAQKVTQDLDKAADGWGTDEELMSKANSGISSPGVLSKIEQHYQAKGYKADNEYKTAYEQFQGSELKRSEVYVNNAQLVKNNAIQDQSRRDEIIQTNILEYGKTKENLQSGLDAIGNRTDFDNADRAAAKYNQEHGNQAYFKNQSAINTLIYHQSEGDADSIHAANNKLIDPQENFLTSDEIIRTKAEEGVYYLQEAKEHKKAKGLADQARDASIDSNDAEVYAKIDELLNEKGEPSLKDTVPHTRLAKVGYGNFSADERAEIALNELKSSSYSANAAKPNIYSTGSMTMGTAFSNTANQLNNAKNAEFSMDNLYKVLNSPESYAKFKKMVAQDPKLKTYLVQKGFDENRLKFEAKSSNLSNEEIIENKAQYENIKKALEQSKHEFQSVTSKEGNYDSLINKLRNTYGLGITRESLAKLGEHSSYMLHNLELAADGKLTDAKGNPISFEDYSKELDIVTEKMNETNTRYQQHQAYGKMAVDGIITVATIPVGGGAVKVLSSVVNGVKTFKVVRALDAAGKTVKEIGIVKDLAAAQKLAAATAKAAMSESKVGQAALKAGQHLTSTANIAKSTVTGATSGTVMYGKERLNTMTSAEGDSMEARSQAEKNFASNAAAAGVGYHVGGAAAYLDELGAMGRVAGTAAEVVSDAGTSAMINKAQTGEASISAEDMVTSVIFNAAGHANFGKSHVETPKAQAPQGVTYPTSDAEHHSGGKLNAEKMENARTEVRDIAQNGTPKEVAKAHQAADYEQVQSRAQVADDCKTADFTTEQQRIYQEEMQAGKEAPAPAQKPQETAPQPVEVKPENNFSNSSERVSQTQIDNARERMIKGAELKKQEPISVENKPVSGQKMDNVKSTQTTKAHIKQVIKDLPDNMKQSFVSIYNEISNLTSMVNVAAIRNKISTKFSKYAEALNSLTDRLEAKISSLKNSLKTTSNTGFSSIKVVTTEQEAKLVYQKMMNDRAIDSLDSKKASSVLKDGKPYFYDVDGFRYEIYESSGTGNYKTDFDNLKKQKNTPWKMHIYADSPQEWANAAQVAMPYLQENKIMYKTMFGLDEGNFNLLRNSTNKEGFHSQKGKAFTVYFRSEEEFLQAAKELETRFKQSGLKSSGTVANEHQVGDSGFLSYRHEGAERGTTYKPDNVEDPYLKMLNNEKTTTPKSNNHVVNDEAENLFDDSINMNESNLKQSGTVSNNHVVEGGAENLFDDSINTNEVKNNTPRATNRQYEIRTSGVQYDNQRLNKYKINKNTPVKSHERFYQDNKELFAGTELWEGTQFQGYTPADQHHGAWKMHMYSVDEHDWQQMSEALIPYLKDHGIDWKTFHAESGVHVFNGTVQEGKAFTIYPRNNVEMEQIARDLDYIIKNNGLNINGSNIVGDRAMGDNGRLFYRYEYNTGTAKDMNLDLSNDADYAIYDSLYDGNSDRIKRNGKANYLADDMTPADDPWFNFNPSDPNSYPNVSEYVENLFSA